MNNLTSALLDGIDPALASKVREIIENQWGKNVADLQYLSIGQFYERQTQGDVVSYQSTNRYVLWVQFRFAREPRRTIFTFA